MPEPSRSPAAPDRRLVLAAGLVVLLCASLAPLADPDLPLHLAVGRWIETRGSVPTREPFAWTRPGEPYFAYSWLMQVGMYEAMRLAGPVGLRLLNGVLAVAAFGAALIAGRAFRWSPSAVLLVAAMQLVLLNAVSPLLRPQIALFVLVPLAWAIAQRLLERAALDVRRDAPGIAALALVAALAAGSHILFPLVAAPLALACSLERAHPASAWGARVRRAMPLAIAILIGCLCSPYALRWPDVFELNFAENALFGPTSLVAESQPGFTSKLGLGVLLTLLPLVAARRLTTREAAVYGAMWALGLVAFALKTKALVVWWFLVFPLAGIAAEACLSLGTAYRIIPALLVFVVPLAAGLGYVVGVPPTIVPLTRAWKAEHVTPGASLSSPAALATDTLLRELQTVAPRARVLTVFDLGSYVPWRAPGLSASIDGRTIFPDSAALPDAVVLPTMTARALGPWRSADAALVPLAYPVAAVLDSAAGWTRRATTSVVGSPIGPVALWVRASAAP